MRSVLWTLALAAAAATKFSAECGRLRLACTVDTPDVPIGRTIITPIWHAPDSLPRMLPPPLPNTGHRLLRATTGT